MSTIEPIPQVPKHYLGLLGNVPDIDPSNFAISLWHLTDLYGPIFELQLGSKVVVLSNHELISEALDDDRFTKSVGSTLNEVSHILGEGLFTASTESESWRTAHRILMPVFGPMAVRKMFDDQLDIASQMILKWDRLGPNKEIECSDDFTRLAFDTIGFCSFSYRFNEFYSDSIHPFAQQMADALVEAGRRATRSKLETRLRVFAEQKMFKDINAMHTLCDEILQDRLDNPQPENHDILNTMMNAKDPETGEKMSRQLIIHQMCTFLVAGHETTSGTLSFLFYHLLKNPEKYHKAQQEVDQVLGDGPITVNAVPQLKYLDACVKETLRMMGPITGVERKAKQKTVIGGKYELDPSMTIRPNLRYLHHDPKVWGDDHNDFKPERMLDMSKYPKYAFQPFGAGMRACIGRAFAEQEIIISFALILQRFQVEAADPSYKLELKSTLTIKPADWKIKVRRRPGKSSMVGLQRVDGEKEPAHAPVTSEKSGRALTILYGSNAGTCQAYAEDFASNAGKYGFIPDIRSLDSATEALPTGHPVVIIAPSYEGKPADNSKKFVAWLESTQHDFKQVQYLLFGAGNSEWALTYQRIPKLIDEKLAEMGAQRLAPSGCVDVKLDTVGPWEDWCAEVWPILGGSPTISEPAIKATVEKASTASLLAGFETSTAIVKENIELAAPEAGLRKMHMEVELPEGTTYRTGDYLAILPFNHPENVKRVLNRFQLKADDTITISDTKKAFLKSVHPISIYELLTTRVELGLPITKRQLDKIQHFTRDSKEKEDIERTPYANILDKRCSVIDILEQYPSCALPFADFLDMLKALTPRQYSISSSPLTEQNFNASKVYASITYDVLENAAFSGRGVYHGVTSTFLARARPGDQISCTVRTTNAAFHLPTNLETPIIMICAGTGLAPMRGFLQERAALKAAGRSLGPALLYFGCRDAEGDFIYKDELEQWDKDGVVSIRPTFSRTGNGFRYTSDRLYAEKDEIRRLFVDGAKIFICGSASKIGKSTAETCIKMWREVYPEKSQSDAELWLDSIKEERYVSDVFG